MTCRTRPATEQAMGPGHGPRVLGRAVCARLRALAGSPPASVVSGDLRQALVDHAAIVSPPRSEDPEPIHRGGAGDLVVSVLGRWRGSRHQAALTGASPSPEPAATSVASGAATYAAFISY